MSIMRTICNFALGYAAGYAIQTAINTIKDGTAANANNAMNQYRNYDPEQMWMEQMARTGQGARNFEPIYDSIEDHIFPYY